MSSRPPGGAGSGVCFGPREPDKPFADSERAQKWRLSLASLLFFTVLLSDHLWLCVEARQVAAGRHRDPERAGAGREDGMDGAAEAEGGGGGGQCFSLLGDAEAACRRLQQPGASAQAELYLPFCSSYTLRELFAGLSRPDTLNCTLDLGEGDGDEELDGEGRRREDEDWLGSCRRCVLAYQNYDQQAQDRYREFELVLQKYLQAEEYSVKSGPEDCKVGVLSTKPGSVPSILKSHSLTATTQFLASNTVWRFRQGVHLYYQTTMMSSMEDYPVSSVQGSMTTIQPMQNQNAVMSDGDYYQITNPKGL
ncbi:NALCN channel auxiliary factor 1 isoform X2 [Podarcis raffonei]|uniref:NALCN channel auxiliary factor 1 isoform X2 n=1 Tax=Podarcis raffonei TaxID=65483 RepID=UPI0023291A2F|nr:NALCN channel auxiliary factor 1 isoform X2 [Podarcis raffonei]